jgi:serine/threonine-protein kinase
MGNRDARDREDVPPLRTRALTRSTDDEPHDSLARKLPRADDVIADKYTIDECLGQGGMGAVFSATHRVTGKRVAIKWMLPSTKEQAHKRFAREAQVAGRIDHPNVVDVYDIGMHDNCSYLVMALLRGESLRKRLTYGPLGVAACISLLLPALRGVSAVHRAGVIHRDLKPDNIFLCEVTGAQQPEAKVLDFGISAIVSASIEDSRLTGVGMFLGTPAYMSPEQLRDPSSVDIRSDVYAFGVILYECLAGVQPFRAETYSALVIAIANDQPKHPSALRPEIPSELGDIVMRALAKPCDDRWPDIESLMAALAPFAREPEARAMRRFSLARFAALGLGLMVLIGLAYVSNRWLARSSAVPSEAMVRPAPRVVPVAAPPEAEPPALTPETSNTTASHTVPGPTVNPAPVQRKARSARPSPAVPRTAPTDTDPTRGVGVGSGRISLDEL